MTKTKAVYVCSNCGTDSPRWLDKCPNCGEWNTYVKEIVTKEPAVKRPVPGIIEDNKIRLMLLYDIMTEEEARIDLEDDELNKVLGGGLVKDSLVLVGGEPRIGKSTLVLQTVSGLTGLKTLYVSGEESSHQLKLRAGRLSHDNPNRFIPYKTHLEQIFTQAASIRSDLTIVDPIQTIFTKTMGSSPGNVSQVRECSAAILKYAKESSVPVLLIGHISKEGSIAGPKVSEHIVDTVLQFGDDQHYVYRILRSIKNRSGSTAELGIYGMRQNGLREVSSPSELLLTQSHEGLSGTAIAAAVEGVRSFLIETQTLVSSTVYGTPQYSATGFDSRQMSMLLAVLEKKTGFKLIQKDVFLNVAGGLKMNDPAIDLAIISSILSSNLDIDIKPGACMAGEVGLSGEIHPVNRIGQRILEAEKLSFSRIIIPHDNLKGLDTAKSRIQIVQTKKVEEAFRQLFGQYVINNDKKIIAQNIAGGGC